jgi:beta-glucosidase
MSPKPFPPEFLWGVATSAHQVEGGNIHNQWATWESQGHIRDGHCGGACDWWNRSSDDLDLAQQMGVNAFRISIEWSRLEPVEGHWDKAALARYYNLLLALNRRGLRSFVTLHHFTHPQWFEDRGGFLAPDAVETFSRFVYRTVEALHHLCHDWVTINEPNVYCAFGYMTGEFPPGQKGNLSATLRAMGRMAQCHAAAYRIIHGFQPDANVGWAQNYVVFRAGSENYLDRVAARLFDQLFNRSFFDLLHTGRLPAPWDRIGENAPEAEQKFDFVGLNVYNRLHVAVDPRARESLFSRVYVPTSVPQGDRATEIPYGECYPDAITEAAVYASQFGRPIYITENGVPDRSDRIRPWLLVHAIQRIAELMEAGYDIRGYFHWTLVDSFEWTEGWRLRFGLYELNPQTQARYPRPSAQLYSEIIKAKGLLPELFERYGDLTSIGDQTAEGISNDNSETVIHTQFTRR